ncbi:MAG: hypothetical protein LHW59_03920, partial [Candidatus Cloacimonetes bacterium]|nr:hypothetical protein [Candidatus Cloacimonadota bacterium]
GRILQCAWGILAVVEQIHETATHPHIADLYVRSTGLVVIMITTMPNQHPCIMKLRPIPDYSTVLVR